MSISFSPNPPTAEAFKALYDTTGWTAEERESGFFAAAIAGSWATCAAYDGNCLVGIGRVISDGALHAFITEMIVAEKYRGTGIGGGILKRLIDACHAAGVSDIQLFCAEGRAEFYRSHGFEPRPANAPGMQYLGSQPAN